MPEILINQERILSEAVRFEDELQRSASNLGDNLYRPSEIDIPHPSFDSLTPSLEAVGMKAQNGFYDIYAEHSVRLPQGLRGIASFYLLRNDGQKALITGPAIVGPRDDLIVLLAEAGSDDLRRGRISEFQHLLLEAEYAKAFAETGPDHSDNDGANVGKIDAALTIAATIDSRSVHSRLHDLAKNNEFGPNLARSGAHNLIVGGSERTVLSGFVPRSEARFLTAKHHQVDEAASSQLSLTPAQLVVGITRVAGITQGKVINIGNNVAGMVS